MRILVTGATGYIGGRLVPKLLDAGHDVRVLVRDARRVKGRPWADRVEVFEGDLTKPETLTPAFVGVDAAYYLVHSMYAGVDFAKRDREAAGNFVAAAQHVAHTIYLGGLLPQGEGVSKHLTSRAETGEILRAGLPATEFRAGPIIGSGSASFEMVRYLTERLPVMVAPKWIDNLVQPVAIRDVLAYLVTALEVGPQGIVDIGANQLTFRDMMHGYAEVRGLKRAIFKVPVLTPTLAALWVGLVTPISNSLAVPLVQGVVHPVVGDTARARALFPAIDPIPYRKAVGLALERVDGGEVQTRWSGALGDAPTWEISDWEGMTREEHSMRVRATPDVVFRTFTSLGGERGWLVWAWAWEARGAVDQLVGGPGLRRGRRDPEELLPGEALDFWRVEEVRPPAEDPEGCGLLRLRAEMKVPGRAWLQFEAIPEDGGTRLVQTALFAPKGLPGAAYWYGLYPLHAFIFRDMLRAVGREAERRAADERRRAPANAGR
jgi:uncharacterized protein YbjT (DUF2867 family)